ncbi:MAG: ATP-binding protein [Pseudanabaenaceae cyanobacterium SKYGB_i_bin29]|nr:ATP-binding protein [Pseudanabaenaceae cyanobacterium SKYG29]MDW8420751.1 ATP-binding protein [Pseudanabaenaceae cyanobacterium SKYGB_i_bin29]
MPPAPLPSNESERLQELYRYGILDTPPEPDFDKLTLLAANICQAPVAMINLVDADRVWVKSSYGLPVCEVGRQDAMCSYTILSESPFIVEDATQDAQVSDSPLVCQVPHVRFYLGVPLISPRRFSLGSFCIIDFVPRQIEQQKVQMLQTLAEQAVHLFESKLYQQKIHQYAKALAEANLAKSRFVATLSHEIRTPLNGVIGSLHLLGQTNLEPAQQEYYHIAYISSKAILALVNEVLDLAKIEAGKLELVPQPTNLESLAREVQTIVTPQLQEKQVNLILDYDDHIPSWVSVDGDRVRQVLLNLTGNAVKFTPTGKSITLKFVLVERSDEQAVVEVQVRDQGIGMTPEEQQRILAPFSQANNQVSKQYGGTGLGLSISNELLKLMGSHLQLTSAKGEGTTFSFVLTVPLASPPSPEESHPEMKDTLPSLRILLAEDSPTNRLVIERILTRKGHRVVAVSNGQEAVARAKVEQFDVAILDLEMPLMSGEEATKAIKDYRPFLPVLITSGHALSDVQARVQEFADGYLTKPIDVQELDKLLRLTTFRSQPAPWS